MSKIGRRSFLQLSGVAVSTASIAGYMKRRGTGSGGETDSDENESDRSSGESELTDAERESIRFVREEEKLAHDVYTVFEDEWNLTVFANIVESEQAHIEAVGELVEKYDIDDPYTDQLGVFENDELQDTYDSFVAEGRESVVAALRVGGAIEEVDVIDLQERIDATDNPDIERVFENLVDGSKNHLRAFVSVLDRYGVEYEPQYLSDETFDAIVDD